MVDLFYFTSRPLTLVAVAECAAELGWTVVGPAEDSIAMHQQDDPFSHCEWYLFDVLAAEPSAAQELLDTGMYSAFCVSHHRGNHKLWELMKALLQKNEGWVGNDTDDFRPRFDASSIDELVYWNGR